MRAWLVVSAILATVMLASAALAQQQAPPCPDLVTCQFRVIDLKDYREYLEDQLARLRSLFSTVSQQATKKDEELKLLKEKCGDRCETKPVEKPHAP